MSTSPASFTFSSSAMAMSFSPVAIAVALTLVCVPPVFAQMEAISNCNGCVNSKNIKDKTIKPQDLAPGVLPVETIPVRADGGANANCARLRDALAGIGNASAARPVVIKLDRGNYRCGSEPLQLKRFVAIEGAGRAFSRIIGNPVNGIARGVVLGANDSALRHLTVEHRGLAVPGSATALNTGGTRMRLSDVAVKIDSAIANTAFGIFAHGGSLELTDVSVQSSAINGQTQGIHLESGARLNMMNVRVHNQSGNVGSPAALDLDDSSATGFGVLISSDFFSLLGDGDSVLELFDGIVIGNRDAGSASFTCVGIADGDFTARSADCG